MKSPYPSFTVLGICGAAVTDRPRVAAVVMPARRTADRMRLLLRGIEQASDFEEVLQLRHPGRKLRTSSPAPEPVAALLEDMELCHGTRARRVHEQLGVAE